MRLRRTWSRSAPRPSEVAFGCLAQSRVTRYALDVPRHARPTAQREAVPPFADEATIPLPVNLSSGNARWRSIETALFLASVLLTVWALALWLTGGFVFDIASIHIASRRPRNPAVLALVCGLFSIRRWAAVWRRSRDVRREVLRRVERVFDLLGRLIATLAPFIGAGAALGIVVVAIARGAFVAGGSDSYGYVSQAHLWRNWDFFLR